MEPSASAGVELATELGGNRRRDQLARGRQVVEPLEQRVKPVWNAGAARRSESPGRRDIRHRQNTGNDLDVQAGTRDCILEAKETVRRKKELGDGTVGAGLNLALQIL